MIEDVPTPIDLRLMSDAREWEATAMAKRPWRSEFFDRFAAEMAASAVPTRRILELGSGPGFLADRLLREFRHVDYVALDFSAAMHRLATERLGPRASRVQFVERSFREEDWSQGLGHFQFVVTNQAVHELRHKRHAAGLHVAVRQLLEPGGAYLVCDHFVGEGGMSNEQLYMSVEEQQAVLRGAGFANVSMLLLKGGLALHRAT